jgi:hypothetical protein
MVRLMVRHPVADYDAWRAAYDEFDDERRGMGVTGHGVYRAVDDPRDVTVWHEFESVRAARGFAGSDELGALMATAGVAGDPEIWLVTEA